jgi:signal transduction histidine kinase
MDESLDSDLAPETLVHDLNSVFETITEAAELLAQDRRWKPLADTLSRSAARGRRLLGAIPDRTPNLAAIVEDAIQSVNDYCAATRRPRLRFVRQIPPDAHLPGAAKDWERVFANLFLNAAQIMNVPGRIEILAQKQENFLRIVVSDNGPGIPPEILPRLFRPHVSTKAAHPQAENVRCGLGLHIVQSIVKKYSGQVSAANRERAAGAVFTIQVPLASC